MDDQWRQIVEWLTAHAPRSAALLRAPTSPSPRPRRAAAAGSWFDVQHGVDRDLRASVLFGYAPLSGAEAAAAQDIVAELLPEWLRDWDLVDDGDVDPFVPIADSGAGTLLVIDARAGSELGAVVELDWEDPTTLEKPLWSQIDHLLDAVLETLHGRATGPFGISPLVSDGYLRWTLPTQQTPAPDVHDGPPPRPHPGWSWATVSARVGEHWYRNPLDEDARLSLVGAALDRLVGLTLDDLTAATADAPEEIGTVDLNVLLAACVDYAFAARDLDPPAWARGRWVFMRPSWTITGFPSAEIQRLRSTPPVFLEHGITFAF